MPNFTLTNSAQPRFDGDFQLGAKPNYQATQPEQTYVEALQGAVDFLAAEEAADTAAAYPQTLLLLRQAARKAAAAELKTEATRFIGGQNSAGDVAGVSRVKSQYVGTAPKFGTIDRNPPKFEGDFEIVTVQGYIPDADAQTFLDSVQKATTEFAADKARDIAGDFSPSVVTFRERQRKTTADALRDLVAEFSGGKVQGVAAAESVLLIRGRYQALRDRLKRRLFNVKLLSEEKKQEADNTEWVLDINLLGGLPPPEDLPSPDKQQLYVQINKAHTVIRTVCDRISERAERGWRARLGQPDKLAPRRARLVHKEFIEKLHGVAWIGLELNFTELAKLTLAELCNEFFVLEAGRIKNIYVRNLGLWAGLFALAFLTAYLFVEINHPNWAWGQSHKTFLLAACGASIGTWASFSVRQVQFTFDDLVMLDEHALDPPLRVAFVVALTLITCLLFWTGAVNIEIGNLKTQQGSFQNSGSIAFLIGMFAGLSERALATAISGRAAAFVRSVAGG